MELRHFMKDGADYQARAVAAYLSGWDGVEESWSKEHKRYDAEPQIARWDNCREQGYVVYLRSKDFKRQLNIAFYEHRNSDSICAVTWEQKTFNAPALDTAEFGDKFKNKWDTDFDVKYGEAGKMADWVWQQLVTFWKDTAPIKEAT